MSNSNSPTAAGPASARTARRQPWFLRLHRGLLWLAALALFAWVLSGLLHPLMGLLGPRQAAFVAPPLRVSSAELSAGLAAVVPQLAAARLARLVPGPSAALWQLTDEANAPRRYLQLDGSPADLDDAGYAQWLAEHYTGQREPLGPPTLLTDFDADYPWVNRLLPVWRLDFDTPGGHSAYVHTETVSVTSYVDTRKRLLQDGFRLVHTLDFLSCSEPLRLALLSLLMLSTLVAVGSGLLLAWSRWRRPAPTARRWHRRLGLIVALPVALMAASGLLHALVTRGPPLAPALAPPPGQLAGVFASVNAAPQRWRQALPAQLDAAALRSGPQGQPWLVFRAAMAEAGHGASTGGHHPAPSTTAQRGLQGLPLDLVEPPLLSEQTLGEAAAQSHLGRRTDGQPRLGFDADYDFRNRRLPAWGVVDSSSGDQLSFDPLTGQLIDRAPGGRRFEAWTFSWLHKWNPLSGPLGRFGRDGLQAAWLLLALLVAGIGLRIRLLGARALRAKRLAESSATPR